MLCSKCSLEAPEAPKAPEDIPQEVTPALTLTLKSEPSNSNSNPKILILPPGQYFRSNPNPKPMHSLPSQSSLWLVLIFILCVGDTTYGGLRWPWSPIRELVGQSPS